MSRSCLLIHDLALPGAGSPSAIATHAWSLASALRAAGESVTFLHTGDPVDGLDEAARNAGAGYRRLESFLGPFDAPVFPAAPAHRIGLRVSHAVGQMNPDALWVLGTPAHAAATASARVCGRPGMPRRLAIVLDDPRERAREAASAFPNEGRADIVADYLERRATAGADELFVADAGILDFLRNAGWAFPERSQVLGFLTGSDSQAARAAWTRPGDFVSPEAVPPLPVAVCIPYYEQPTFLGEALALIAAQSRPPAEVIVVDDGSKSPEAAAAFAKAQETYGPKGWKFLRQANAGPAAARNRAATEAHAPALIFCDADNRFHSDMIAVLAQALAMSGADCVSCAFKAFREEGDPAAASDPGYVFCPVGACLELGLVENAFGDTNFIVRRDVFRARGGFPADNRSASEDWQFLLQLVAGGGALETVPAVLFDYRLAAQSHARRNTELASARAALGPALSKLDPAWRKLWQHLAGLVRDPRLPHAEAQLETEQRLRSVAEGELSALKKAYAEVERGSAEREKAYALLETDLANTKEAFAQTQRDHEKTERDWQRRDRARRANAFLLATSQEALEERIRAKTAEAAEQHHRDATEIEELSRRKADLEREVERRGDKIRRMQDSFSWKATTPLRAARRALLDRASPGGEADTAGQPQPTPWRFHRHLDAPRKWERAEAEVTIRGWFFAEELAEPLVLRARVGVRSYIGVHGLARPDLLNAFPAWPQSGKAGFKIEALILPGDSHVVLEASGPDGLWRPFLEVSLEKAGKAAAGSYEHWVQTYDTLGAGELEALRKASPAKGPTISVLMPVFNPAEKWLARAIQSVVEQTYPHWELCIADDASTAEYVKPLLEKAARDEPRIRLALRTQNGHISEATNSALGLATGEYVALFDHDDELAPHALQCIAREIAAHPAAELLYSDEDKIDEQGNRFDPHFKPDWNPDLLLGQNYLSHLSVYRTETLREAGGLRKGFEGCQDWDLALRVSETLPAAAIRHIPRVLYHWRAGEGSTSLHLGEKNYITEAARKTLQGHFDRLKETVELRQTFGGHWRSIRPLPKEKPLVSIIIPTHNAAKLVHVCTASIFARTLYEPYEILLVNNRSDDPDALALFRQLASDDAVRVLDYDKPFNYSAINNFAAREANGEILCLLNNDIEVLDEGWLGELVSHAVRPEIGAVGARLYYPDFRLQHAGVITGLGGVAGHAFKEFGREDPGTPQFRPHLTQNLSAVTAACLAIRKSTYLAAGGFDEKELAVAFNDVDFCLKVEALGLRNLYTPFAELLHHESASRGSENTPEKVRRFQGEIEAIKRRWGERLLRDPAYNPNLSLDSEDFALARPPRTPPLVAPPSLSS